MVSFPWAAEDLHDEVCGQKGVACPLKWAHPVWFALSPGVVVCVVTGAFRCPLAFLIHLSLLAFASSLVWDVTSGSVLSGSSGRWRVMLMSTTGRGGFCVLSSSSPSTDRSPQLCGGEGGVFSGFIGIFLGSSPDLRTSSRSQTGWPFLIAAVTTW